VTLVRGKEGGKGGMGSASGREGGGGEGGEDERGRVLVWGGRDWEVAGVG